MQYQVPQFIEVEDKLLGPFTFKQFIYMGGGLGLAYAAYVYLPLYIAFIVILASVGLGVSLAFVKVNKKPFINIMESAFKHFSHARLYVWRKEPQQKSEAVETNNSSSGPEIAETPSLGKKKLKDLAWSLDIHDIQNQTPREETAPPNPPAS